MRRILIIDGDNAVGTAIKLWLEVEGADATHIGDGSEGIEAIRTGGFDLVIVELSTPGLKGIETIKVVHDIEPTTSIIVISNSLHWSDGQCLVDQAIALGAARVLGKPFKPRDLMQAIEASLGGSLGEPRALRGDEKR